MSDDRVLVELNPDQLRKLATAVRAQELEKLHSIKFRSYSEKLEYINTCNDSHKTVEELLNKMEKMKSEADQSTDETKKSIARDVFEYALKGATTSLELIQSYHVRKTHLQKLSVHCDSLLKRLHSLDPSNLKEAKDLALEALTYRRAVLDHAKKMQKFIPNLFTKLLKERRLTFEQLLVEFKAKHGFTKPFKDLTDIQKLQVYESIIEAAGKGKPVVTYSFQALGAVGAAVLVFTAGAMVWDIFTAEDKIESVVRGMTGLLLIPLDLTAVATAAIKSGLAMAKIQVAGAALTVAGTVVGIGAVVLIGVAIGAVLDLIFSSGSTQVMTTERLSTNCYLSHMPNGVELARIIKANNP